MKAIKLIFVLTLSCSILLAFIGTASAAFGQSKSGGAGGNEIISPDTGNCEWIGNAPFCGHPTCQPGWTQVDRDRRGDGSRCLTGKKVKCCLARVAVTPVPGWTPTPTRTSTTKFPKYTPIYNTGTPAAAVKYPTLPHSTPRTRIIPIQTPSPFGPGTQPTRSPYMYPTPTQSPYMYPTPTQSPYVYPTPTPTPTWRPSPAFDNKGRGDYSGGRYGPEPETKPTKSSNSRKEDILKFLKSLDSLQ